VPNSQDNIMTAEELNLAVQTNSANYVSNTLTSTSITSPAPAGYSIARWNSGNQNLQTRPSGNSYTLLMATLQNDTGGDLYGLEVSYDYAAVIAAGAYIQEEINGYLTYYSLTGEPNSWVLIPELSTNGNPESTIQLTARFSFDSPWLAGSNLFLLWADDNSMATSSDSSDPGREAAYTIDNFSANPVAAPLAVKINPKDPLISQCDSITLTARATGGNPPYSFQWHASDFPSPIENATNATLVISNVQVANALNYIVEVKDSTPETPQTQTNSSLLTMAPDTNAPAILSALGYADLLTLWLTFSEPIQLSSNTGDNFILRALDGTGELTLTTSVVTNGTNVILTTLEPRELKDYEIVIRGNGIQDLCGGLAAADGSGVPLLSELVLATSMTPTDGVAIQCGTATFQAISFGGTTPYSYQWYKGEPNSPIPGATDATLVLSNLQPVDAGDYFVVVTDSTLDTPQQAQSSRLALQVVPETVPVMLGALGATNLQTILVAFSKPITISSDTGGNFQVQPQDGSGDLTIACSVVTNGTNVLLTTVEPHALKNYTVTLQDGVAGCAGPIASGTTVPLASQVVLIGLSDSTPWSYRADGIDPGSDWMLPGINLENWSTNMAVFDAKRGSNRTCITLTNLALDIPVQSSLPLTTLDYEADQADIPTYFFRASFSFPGDPAQSSLRVVTFFDDSGVVFLNGQEAWRLRVTNDLANQLSFEIYCPIQPAPDASLEGPFELPITNVVNGENLIAVCLKQANDYSSDITMGLSLIATVTNFPVVVTPPTLAMTPVGDELEFSWPDTGAAFQLQSTTSFALGWTQVPETDNPSGGYHRVRVSPATGTRFFRLYKP
jgi:hypothetical protein